MAASGFNLPHSLTVKPGDYNSSTDVKLSKRPDKTLPCPRCNSLDTKFCYYNNYNVNQPRHFCKGCQRYWTAGGSLRNVAIGAGQRKRKHCSFESESGTEASSVECHNPQDCLHTRSSLHDCKLPSSLEDPTGSSYRAGGVSYNELLLPPMDSSYFVSGNLFSEIIQGNLSNKSGLAKKSFVSEQSMGWRMHSSLDIRKQEAKYYEFMQSKSKSALSEKHIDHCDSVQNLYKSINKSNFFLTQRDELKDMGRKLILAMPSERQASNESGCASSLTTQALSEDACTSGGRSDVDSEISKECDNCDNGDNLAYDKLGLSNHGSCKMSGGVSTVDSSFQGDMAGSASGMSMMHAWKGAVENCEFGAAWTLLPMPPFPLASSDRVGCIWGAPWCTTENDVNAAKVALISNAGVLQKPQSRSEAATPEKCFWVPKTTRFKDVDEAARSSIWSTLGIS